MTYDSGGGWRGPDGQWASDGRWDSDAQRTTDGRWQSEEYQPTPQRGPSGAVIALIAVLAVVLVALLAAIGYLVLRPGGVSGTEQSQAAGGASSSSSPTTSAAPQVTETAYTTAPQPETVTVTRQAPLTRSRGDAGAYPAGADYSGWLSNSQARCNAGDPAAMIGQTTQSSFSICVNPDNGRYYYKGSAGGAGVEVDDPVVTGASATVVNNGVVYSIDAGGMTIYEGGAVISDQPMVDFWAG